MATQRSARKGDSVVRFGRGRAPSSVAGAAKRVGLKDANAGRTVVMGVRLTAAQNAEIRAAFARDGAGKTFGVFAAELLIEAASGRGASLSFIVPPAQQGLGDAALAEIKSLIDRLAESMDEKFAALARHQKGLQSRLEGTMDSVDNLAKGLGGVSDHLDALGPQLAIAARAIDEVGKRKAPRAEQDEFTKKLI